MMSEQPDEQVDQQIEAGAALIESEPAPVRRYRAALFRAALVLVACAFAGLTFLVKTTPSFAIDLQVTQAIQRLNFPATAFLMNLISWPGFNPQATIISALIIIIISTSGLRWEAVVTLISVILSTAINLLVKDMIQRPRPTPDLVSVFAPLNSYSFPSGHVMFYLGLFGFLGFLAFSLLKPSLKRSLILALCGGLVALIGVSRISLGEHWASDALGSYLLGSLMLAAVIQFYLWGKPRFFVAQPAAAAEPPEA
jgi:membrane-associated phospholipid phosphatase